MPLKKKGKKIKKSMVKQYGKKKGEAVFYAMENSGKLKGVNKNKDYQEPHVHAFTKFSFIIYKKIVEPRTIFFNPAKNVISMLGADDIFPTSYMPKLKSGSIIIFPSFIEHMVVPNSDQITISGNLIFNKIEDKKCH